jgi:SAM-dependent methyltransferase
MDVAYGNQDAPAIGEAGRIDRLLEATRRVEARHFWFRGLRRFVRPLLEASTAGLPSARILDCGCGTGGNLRMLGRHGTAFGFDLTWTGLRHARGYGERRVARACMTRMPFADASFDLVTAFDVLYALPDSDEPLAVDEMFRVLRPGGRTIVNVAALNILRGNHAVFGQEVRRSTRRRLRALLARAGFRIERLTYTNASLFPIMLVVRTAQRMAGLASPEEAGTDIALPPAPVNALLSTAVTLESMALRWMDMPIGSSLLCLARKPEDGRASQARRAGPGSSGGLRPSSGPQHAEGDEVRRQRHEGGAQRRAHQEGPEERSDQRG